jgi:hypothetical protein
MSHQPDEEGNHCDHSGVYQIVARYQLQHWVLSRLLARKVALREKRTSTTPDLTNRRPPPRHFCVRHDDRESDREGGPVLATPTQEEIDDFKSKVDVSARHLEIAEEQYRVFSTQVGSHSQPSELPWRLPPWKAFVGLEELPVCPFAFCC